MKQYDIHMDFEFPNDNSAVMQDCALRAFAAIESKPEDYDLRGDHLIIEFRNREFPSRFEALSWAKSLEEKILPEISALFIVSEQRSQLATPHPGKTSEQIA